MHGLWGSGEDWEGLANIGDDASPLDIGWGKVLLEDTGEEGDNRLRLISGGGFCGEGPCGGGVCRGGVCGGGYCVGCGRSRLYDGGGKLRER